MKPYLVKTPKLVKWIFPKRIWAFPKDNTSIYLTFDDGPIPEVTPWVLQKLKKYNAKATFFCIGDNIKKHPEIFKAVLSEGHAIGNHTFNHLNGWKTETSTYVENVLKASKTIQESKNIKRQLLFRPPFGRITSKQSKTLQKLGFKIIMWDILSADFDASVSKENCFQNVFKNIYPGSIIVFHDSLKSEKNLRYALPKILEFISKNGWKCKSI